VRGLGRPDPEKADNVTMTWQVWRQRVPGIAWAAIIAAAGKWLATALSVQVARLSGLDPAGHDAQSLVSAISVAVVLGLIWRNTAGVHPVLRPGLAWVVKTGLRFGIVLLGFKLALGTAGEISRTALPVAAICIASALLIVTFINNRLGLPRRLGALIAVGTSVCGVSAIVATGPAIGATDDETSYAVACITIFGLLALFTYPWIAHAAFGPSPMLAGIFLGTSIHDTSQVAGASLMYQETFSAPLALQAATVTKLLRNMSMAVLIPLIATRFRADHRRLTLKEIRSAVPGFVFLFLGAIALRTIGDAVLAGSPEALTNWKAFLGAANTASTWALTIALAGIGLSTDLAKLRGLGLKPLLVGFAAALSVGVVSYLSLTLLAARSSW
jgi:uncharacterized integral membrane protein (TIGR00698 family)